MLPPNILSNRRLVQHPNTYAHPEGTSLEVPALGLKEGERNWDLTRPFPSCYRPGTSREDAPSPFQPEK